MSYPWVARAAYERQSRELIERIADLQALRRLYADVREQHDAQVTQLHATIAELVAITRDLTVPARVTAVLTVPDAPRERTVIDEKIELESDGDPKVARYFRAEVRRLMREGKSDGDILAAIGWQTTETGTE